MKLKQIVCDGINLNLIKEKKVIEYGEAFKEMIKMPNNVASSKKIPVPENVHK